MQIDLEKWKEVRRVACKREDRFRRNTIAFWLSDEEKSQVEAKIIFSGISKGEYYRKAVLGQEVTVMVRYLRGMLKKQRSLVSPY